MPDEALLIDFDGTLAYTAGPDDDLLAEVACKYSGSRVGLSDVAEYRHVSINGMMKGIMKDEGVEDYETVGDVCTSEYMSRYGEVLARSRLINPCTRKILGALKDASGMKTAIVSSGENPKLDMAVRHFGLEGAADLVIGLEDGERVKPAPDLYLRALSELGADAKYSFAVEDTARGIDAARAAGIGTVYGIKTEWNDWKDLEGADGTIRSLNELLPLFL